MGRRKVILLPLPSTLSAQMRLRGSPGSSTGRGSPGSSTGRGSPGSSTGRGSPGSRTGLRWFTDKAVSDSICDSIIATIAKFYIRYKQKL